MARMRMAIEIMIYEKTFPPEQLFNAMFCITVHWGHVYAEDGMFMRSLKDYEQYLISRNIYEPFHRFRALAFKLLPISFIKVLNKVNGIGCFFMSFDTIIIVNGAIDQHTALRHVTHKLVRADFINIISNTIPQKAPIHVLLILMVIHSAWTGDLRWYDTAVMTLSISDVSEIGQPWSIFLIRAEDVDLYWNMYECLRNDYADVYMRITNEDDPVVERWNGAVRYRFTNTVEI